MFVAGTYRRTLIIMHVYFLLAKSPGHGAFRIHHQKYATLDFACQENWTFAEPR